MSSSLDQQTTELITKVEQYTWHGLETAVKVEGQKVKVHIWAVEELIGKCIKIYLDGQVQAEIWFDGEVILKNWDSPEFTLKLVDAVKKKIRVLMGKPPTP